MKKILVGLLVSFSLVTSAFAHFQVMYTPDSVVTENEVLFKLVFTHPFNAGHTMNIGENEKGEIKGFEYLYVYHKGDKKEVSKSLKEITFTSLENSGTAYEFVLDKKSGLKGGGDWVLLGVPHPYYEASEDIYIQQIAKVMINKNDIATDWDARLAEGYPEIVPFVKPYEVWAGGMFRGKVVDCEGNPVPLAEIEVEYMNYGVDMKENKFSGEPRIRKEGHGAAVILADRQGNFSFIPPKQGFWGFAALGAGGEKSFGGKELSQDAVLWIEAKMIGDGMPVAAKTTVETSAATTSGVSGNNRSIIILIALAAIVVICFVVLKKRK